jgi:long-chain acyl-CoA synthetase
MIEPMEVGSIAELLRAHAIARGGHPAILFGDQVTTYAQLDRRSTCTAAALGAAGVGPGDRVAYLGKNSPAFFELLFGTAKVGAIFVPINWRLAPPEIARVLDDCDARVVAVDATFRPAIDEPALRRAGRTVVVVSAERPSTTSSGDRWFDDWRDAAGSGAVDPGARPAPDDVALVLYTSGTTGVPKGAMLTNRNLWAMLGPTARDWGFEAASVNLVTLPNFHIGGVGWALVGLYAGASSVVLPEFDARAVLRVVPLHEVTHAVLVPAVISALLATPGVDTTDFSSLRYLVYGASPIAETVLVDALDRFGCRFVQSYGLTETAGGVIQLLPDDHDPGGAHAHRLRSAGRPMEHVEMLVVDPGTGEPRPEGVVGEVWLRSPRVMAGYWGRPDETAAVIDASGWFHTGDAGYLDGDGYLYISDRVKDMIISGGENIFPAEVENALMAHPDVADVAVIGVPSERWGETPKAVVVPAPGAIVDEADLIEFCRGRLARYKCPTSVVVTDVLPRNPTGKVLKHELRAPYWSGRDRHVN